MATTLLKIAADTQLSLAAAVTVGQTTATLSSATDPDGVALPSGKYGFTVDGDTSAKEYIVCDLVGTTLTNVQNITRQGATSTGFANYHRVGATVTITDWAILSRMLNNLNGTTGFDSGTNLGYDGAPAGLTGNQFATVNYVLSVVNGGAVSFDQQVLTNQTAGENLTIRDHVYLKAADAKWYKVDADDSATFLGVERGIALSTVSTNGSVSVSISGPTGGFTGLTAGTKYYASTTGGAITATIPSAPAYETLVGVALNTTTLLLDLLQNTNQFAGSLGNPSSTNVFLTQENTYSALVDQSQTTRNGGTTFGAANTTTNRNKIAQSFVAGTIKTRGVSLYKDADTGSFTGTVTVALQADSAGAPSGVDLASVTITNAQWLLIATGEFSVDFTAEYQQVIGTTYWIVASTSTADTSNHPNLGLNTAGGYANGTLRYNNTTDGWVTISGNDLYFKTLNGTVGQVPTAINKYIPNTILPSGYVLSDVTGGTATANGGEQTVSNKTLLNVFDTNSGIKLTMCFQFATASSSGSDQTLRIKLNGTTVVTIVQAANTGTRYYTATVYIINNGSLSSQIYAYNGLGQGNALAPNFIRGSGTAAATTDSHTQLTVTIQSNDLDNGSAELSSYIVEKIGA